MWGHRGRLHVGNCSRPGSWRKNGSSMTEQAWDGKLGGGEWGEGKIVPTEGTIRPVQGCMGQWVCSRVCSLAWLGCKRKVEWWEKGRHMPVEEYGSYPLVAGMKSRSYISIRFSFQKANSVLWLITCTHSWQTSIALGFLALWAWCLMTLSPGKHAACITIRNKEGKVFLFTRCYPKPSQPCAWWHLDLCFYYVSLFFSPSKHDCFPSSLNFFKSSTTSGFCSSYFCSKKPSALISYCVKNSHKLIGLKQHPIISVSVGQESRQRLDRFFVQGLQDWNWCFLLELRVLKLARLLA